MESYSLDQLCAEIEARYGKDVQIRGRAWGVLEDGEYELWKDGARMMTWKSRPVKMPPVDGVTPRGPSEYYDLKYL